MLSQKAILNTIPYGIIITDADLRLELVNQWLISRLGEAFTLSPGSFLEDQFPELRERGITAVFELVKQSRQAFTISTRIHKHFIKLSSNPDTGLESMPQSTTIVPIFESEKLKNFLVIIQDVTDRVITEIDLQSEIHKLSILHEIDRAISTLDLDACLNIIVEQTVNIFSASFSAVFIKKDGVLSCVAEFGDKSKSGKKTDQHRMVDWCFEHKRTSLIRDTFIETDLTPVISTTRSMMASPMINHQNCFGVLVIESEQPEVFNWYDLELLEGLAARSAVAISNARYFVESEHSRAYLKAINDFTGDIIFTVDTDLKLTSANAGWDHFAVEKFGEEWHSTNCIGKYLLDAFPEEVKNKWKEITSQLLSGELNLYREDIPWSRSNGDYWYNQYCSIMRDSSEKIIGLIFTLRDITQRKLAENQLQSTNYRLEILLNSTRLMSQHQHNTDAMVKSISRHISESYQAYFVIYFRIAQETQTQVHIEAQSTLPFNLKNLELNISSILRSSLDQSSDYIEHDPYLIMKPETLSLDGKDFCENHDLHFSMVKDHGKVIGGFLVLSPISSSISYKEKGEILNAISQQMCVYLENADLYLEQKRLAITDSLTGLYNRRQMDEELNRELSHIDKLNRPLSLMLIDIDHFKQFNDSFGHLAGDELLITISKILKKSVRSVDTVARFGGEEFIILLPETAATEAHIVAERIRKEVMINASKCIHEKAPDYKITISVGLVTCYSHYSTPNKMIEIADQALYSAKNRGRNNIVSTIMENLN